MVVEIKKLRTNYEVRYPFNRALNEFCKGLPKDLCSTHMNHIKREDGTEFDDWYRLFSYGGLGKLIFYIKSNNLKFKFINVEPEEVEQLKNEFLQKKATQENALKAKLDGLDINSVDWSFMKEPPYDYQKQAVLFFELANGKALLGDQAGVGKTLSAITYAVKQNYKTLIICPAGLKFLWKREIERFAGKDSYIFKYIPKKKTREIIIPKENCQFHIINYEGLEAFIKLQFNHKLTFHDREWKITDIKKKYKTCPGCFRENTVKSRLVNEMIFQDNDGIELNPKDYSLVVLDEAHRIKTQKISLTKTVKKAFGNIPNRLLLTGTALLNKSYELFSLLNFIDSDEWKNQHQFGLRYCGGKETQFGWNFDDNTNMLELNERISPYTLRRLREEVIEFLPEVTRTVIPIELTKEEWREYSKIEKNVLDETEEYDTDINHLARLQKLKQYLSEIKTKRTIEFTQDFIDGGNKVVVFSSFVKKADNIANAFIEQSVVFHSKRNPTQKQEAVDAFMTDDKIKVICQDTIDESINQLLETKTKVITQVLDRKEYVNNETIVEYSDNIIKDLVKIMIDKKNGR